MRTRGPRRELERRRRAKARVKLRESSPWDTTPDDGITTRQVAEVTLPRAELERLWSPEYLERLARTYWGYLTRISLGLLRVAYAEDSRSIVFVRRPFVLLRFHAPEYDATAERGTVTWRIDRGLLVAPMGRGRGYLRISVERPSELQDGGDQVTTVVSSEVANFYPVIAGWGWFGRVGRWIYRVTQYRIHIVVTNGFLRSLANLELEESRVGALRGHPDGAEQQAADDAISRSARP